MLIFPIFSTLIWALAMYWRRRWPSFAIVTAALVMLLLLMQLFRVGASTLPPMSKLLDEILWPYIALTGLVGYYICCLPPPAHGVIDCHGCGYHLAGAEPPSG